jgi:hypothetical protein
MVLGDSTGLLPSMPNGLTFMATRPLIIPLAIASLGIGFVLWRFMGDIPSVLGMGLNMLKQRLANDLLTEDLSFTFRKIMVEDRIGKTTFEDNWAAAGF